MLIWTIQPEEVLDSLFKKEILLVEKEKTTFLNDDGFDAFNKAYDWMVKAMDKHCIQGKTENSVYPWWAWVVYKGKHKKPDLRSSGFGTTGEKLVCIELEIPDNEILISSFEEWNCILNDTEVYYLEEGETEEEYDARIESLTSKEYQKYKEASWEKIFEIDSDYKQCVFWNLRKENIRRIQKFVCR